MAAKKPTRHASALKAKRQAQARREHNTEIRSKVRTLTNSVLKAVSEKNSDLAKKSFQAAQAAWAKAAKTGVFHKNVAARKVSRLAVKVASLAKA